MNKLEQAIEFLRKKIDESEESSLQYLHEFSREEQYQILMLAKYILAMRAVELEADMSGKCETCIYKAHLPGTHHVSCANKIAIAIGDEHGIKNGWFYHPFNFDPIWLKYCDGYEENNGKINS